MLQVEYPAYPFRFKKEEGNTFIFDDIRKKWLHITPEEWVRQNFLQYLLQVKKYPASVIAVEKEIRLGDLKKRCDIVVYKMHKPWMIVECKEGAIALNETVLSQALRYNIALQVQILVITNGAVAYAFNIHSGAAKEISVLPVWE